MEAYHHFYYHLLEGVHTITSSKVLSSFRGGKTGNRIFIITLLCIYFLACNAYVNTYGQDAKKVTDSNSPTPEKISEMSSFPQGNATSKTTSVPNRPSENDTNSSNSTFFLKYNNLGNSHNKAGSTSYSFPGYLNSGPSNMGPVPNLPTYPYYNPSSPTYPSLSPYPYPQLASPSYYYPYSQPSIPFSPSFPSASSIYPWASAPSSAISAQQHPQQFEPPYPAPPIPLSSPAMDGPEIVKDSFPESEDTFGRQESKVVSSWFPSIPASDCEGIFEFTLEGTTNLQAKNLKNGNHKITIKMTSASPGSIDGQLWVDKKNNNDKGSKFDIDKTFNNCRVVTASSMPSTTAQQGSSASLLNSLLSDLPEDDFSVDEELKDETDEKDETDNNINSQHQGENDEGIENSKREKNKKIAALE